MIRVGLSSLGSPGVSGRVSIWCMVQTDDWLRNARGLSSCPFTEMSVLLVAAE